MATVTFAGRTREQDLAFMNALTRKEFGVSFGQYCGSILVEAARQGIELPRPDGRNAVSRRAAAVAKMKLLSREKGNLAIGRMSDSEIKELIASRYEG